MNILIIGAGAIGGLVASRIAEGTVNRGGSDTITLVGRKKLVDAFEQQGGLCVLENGATRTVSAISPAASILEAYRQVKLDSSAETDDFDFDLAIFTVKSYDTESAAAELASEVKARGAKLPVVMSLQNGVGNEESLAAAGFTQIIAGNITTPVSVLAPGHIRIDKSNSTVGLAIWANESPAVPLAYHGSISTWPFFNQVGRLFADNQFSVANYRSAQSLKWTKLLMNMLGNASSAILDQAPPEIFAENDVADLEIEAWREALQVMNAAHIEPVNMGKYPFRILTPMIMRSPKSLLRAILRKQVSSGRGGKMPSLHIDLHSGKSRSEVGWLNGAVVNLGQQFDVPTPINQLFYETLTNLLDDRISLEAWQGESKRLVRSAEKYRRWSEQAE